MKARLEVMDNGKCLIDPFNGMGIKGVIIFRLPYGIEVASYQ